MRCFLSAGLDFLGVPPIPTKENTAEEAVGMKKYIEHITRFMMVLSVAIFSLGIGQQAIAQVKGFEDPASVGSSAGGQDLTPVKAEIEGGVIEVGGTVEVISLFKNTSGQPINLKDLELIPSSNISTTIGVNQCSTGPIEPGVECAVTITIQGNAPGDYRVGMLLNHDARSKLSTAAITGTVGGAAARSGSDAGTTIEAIPGDVDFGTLNSRSPLVRSIVLRNPTSQAINIYSIDLVAPDSSGFEVTAIDCVTLQAGQSCIASVTWAPAIQGKVEGLIVARHDGASGVLSIAVKGDYQPTAQSTASRFPNPVPGLGLIIADREEIDFGTEVDGAASITVSLVNNGDAPVTMKSIKLAGSDNGLSLAGDGCMDKTVLQPTEACPMTINWLPRREGPIIDDIQISHTGARGILVLPIRGEAEEPVSSDLPVMSVSDIGDLPKISSANIQEGFVNSKSNKSSGRASAGMGLGSGDSTSLNGYKVTSHSANRAVISGPRGRLIVEDGEVQVIAGSRWITEIVPDGVELIGKKNSVLLVFDRSFNFNNESVSLETSSDDDDDDNNNDDDEN